MKRIGLMSLILAAGFNASAADIFTPKVVSTEKFSAYLYPDQGAMTCIDRNVDHGFGSSPGQISLPNKGHRFGMDRVSDRGDRTSRIEYFGMELPDTLKCAQIEDQIPRTSVGVEVTREIIAYLQKVTLAGNPSVRLVIEEVVTVPISKDITLTGKYTWNDFIVPEDNISPDRDIVTQIITHDPHEESLRMKIHPAMSALECKSTKTNDDKFQLSFRVAHGQINTPVVSRVYANEEACMDALTEILAEISVSQLDNQGFEVYVDKKIASVRRSRIGDNGGTRTDLVRSEKISLTFMGLKFVGTSGLPLWSVN